MAELLPQLTIEHLRIVLAILADLVPDREVRAFGSRARGDARRMSDLDLLIMGEAPVELVRLADLEEALRESDLPFRVDVLDWTRAGEHFRELIVDDSIVIRSSQGHGAVKSTGHTNS